MRFAHISDLHFGSISFSPLQFCSKRWIGNANFLFKRKKEFDYSRIMELIDLFKSEGITYVLISGDLSVTSRKKEFKMGKRFLELLEKEGFLVFTIPGNHDHYTRRSDKKRSFYRYFKGHYDEKCPLNLKEHKVSYTRLQDHLWLVGIDTTLSTSLFSCSGHFSPEVEKNLEKALDTIPKSDKIILLNHYPFFESDNPKNQLRRSPALQALLEKHPNILLYLHGHTHRQTVADLRPSNLPILSDSGAAAHKKSGACHLFKMEDNALELAVYRFSDSWKIDETHNFALQ